MIQAQTFGAMPGTSSNKVLTYMRQNPDKRLCAAEIAALLGLTDKSCYSAFTAGFKVGCFSRERRGHLSYYQFVQMPQEQKSILARRGLNKKQQAFSEMLYTRRIKEEERAEFKRGNSAKSDPIIPPDLKIQCMKLPDNFGNRAHVKLEEVPMIFAALRPGQYLEAA